MPDKTSLKLVRQGIAWPYSSNIPHQERHQDWMMKMQNVV